MFIKGIMGNQNEISNDIEQAEIFLRAISHFKSNAFAMEFWQEKLAHRFPLYRWNGRFLEKRIDDIMESCDDED